MKILFLAALLVASSAFASQNDFLISVVPGGFNVNEVTKDALTLLPGGPFNPKSYPYGNYSSLGVQAAASDGKYLYAIYRADAPTQNSPGFAAMVYTFKVEDGAPKQVSYLRPTDMFGSAGCGRCEPYFTYMSASPQHLFIVNGDTGYPNATQRALNVYHTTYGVLTEMCIVPIGTFGDTVDSVTTDSGEIYAYVKYTDTATGPHTSVFDISTKACKAIGTIND